MPEMTPCYRVYSTSALLCFLNFSFFKPGAVLAPSLLALNVCIAIYSMYPSSRNDKETGFLHAFITPLWWKSSSITILTCVMGSLGHVLQGKCYWKLHVLVWIYKLTKQHHIALQGSDIHHPPTATLWTLSSLHHTGYYTTFPPREK